MNDRVSAGEVVKAVEEIASKTGRLVTPRGRSELRREYEKEIVKKSTQEIYQSGSENVESAATELLKYAESIGAFKSKSRVGTVVVKQTVDELRRQHKETGVCIVWPFC